MSFDLNKRSTYSRGEYFISTTNNLAIENLDSWSLSEETGLIIIGPKYSGKTHLASVWVYENSAKFYEISELVSLDFPSIIEERFLVIENVDKVRDLTMNERSVVEENLFHIFNFIAGKNGKLLMTSQTFPKSWNLGLTDLLSRLMSIRCTILGLPDEKLLRAVMSKQFSDKQIRVPDGVIDYATIRMERSFKFAKILVDALDNEALSLKKPITKSLVNRVIEKFKRNSI